MNDGPRTPSSNHTRPPQSDLDLMCAVGLRLRESGIAGLPLELPPRLESGLQLGINSYGKISGIIAEILSRLEQITLSNQKPNEIVRRVDDLHTAHHGADWHNARMKYPINSDLRINIKTVHARIIEALKEQELTYEQAWAILEKQTRPHYPIASCTISALPVTTHNKAGHPYYPWTPPCYLLR